MVRRVDREQQAGKPIPIFLRCEGAISPMFVYNHMDVADLKLELAERTGKRNASGFRALRPGSERPANGVTSLILIEVTLLQECQHSIKC